MDKVKFILTSIFILPVHLGYAQQNTEMPVKQNSISITMGYNQFKDENIHPKVFHGLLIGSSFQHSKISKGISEYRAGLKVSLVNTVYEEFPSSANILIHGQYKYLFTITQNENLVYHLGPLADLQYGTSAYFNWDESHLYFANCLSGGIGNRITYKTGNKSFDFNIDFPIISIICRPELNRQYKIDNMSFGGIFSNLTSNLESAIPNKNFFVKTSIEMKYLSARNKSRSVGYHFKYHYMKASIGNPYQNIEHAVSYKFMFLP
jgi:hypothetical protein